MGNQRKERVRIIEIHPTLEGFEQGQAFLDAMFRRHAIPRQIISETMLVFEALFHNIQEQGFGEDTVLVLEDRTLVGDISLRIHFTGKMFLLHGESESEEEWETPEERILAAYDDRLECAYRSGYNTIRLNIRRSHSRTTVFCVAAMVAAAVVYAVFCLFASRDFMVYFSDHIVYPVESLFGDAILMLSAPVTFFSLLKNLTDTYIISDRDSSVRKYPRIAITTSLIVTCLAIVAAFVLLPLIRAQQPYIGPHDGLSFHMTFDTLIHSLVPSTIFEPFESISPFPLIVMALIAAYAFISIGKYFSTIKKAVDVCYALFSRMLSVVMTLLPIFCFLAMLDVLLGYGTLQMLRIYLFGFLCMACLVLVAVFYAIRLWVHGVRVKPFVKELPPLIKENFMINSAIDACAFNIRYCVRHFGMDRKRVETALPVLAQINLDGNCFLGTLLGLLILFTNNSSIPAAGDIIIIAVLVMFLSLGAPNQPGSLTILLLIITYYTGALDLLPLVIFSEVILSGAQAITNVVGDFVAVAIDGTSYRKNQGTERQGTQ